MNKNKTGILLAILAAALYSISTPISKLLLESMPSTILAGLLYLGAGAGMAIFGLVSKSIGKSNNEEKLTKDDMPYVVAMVVLDIAAPILLLLGLSYATAENVSLLNNFEIVATAVIAFIFFGEKISKKLGIAIGLITLSSIILSFENLAAFEFSVGSILVLLAAVCWGLENNCTRKLSSKDPLDEIEDMEYNEEEKVFLYQCPCGDKFRAELSFLKAEYQKDKTKGYVIAPCPSCSLLLKVIFDEKFLEQFQ